MDRPSRGRGALSADTRSLAEPEGSGRPVSLQKDRPAAWQNIEPPHRKRPKSFNASNSTKPSCHRRGTLRQSYNAPPYKAAHPPRVVLEQRAPRPNMLGGTLRGRQRESPYHVALVPRRPRRYRTKGRPQCERRRNGHAHMYGRGRKPASETSHSQRAFPDSSAIPAPLKSCGLYLESTISPTPILRKGSKSCFVIYEPSEGGGGGSRPQTR